MTEEEKSEMIKAGMLLHYPGHWMMSGSRLEDDGYREWSVLRKPDGTYWQVTSVDFVKSDGVEAGEQIVNAKALAYCEDMYAQWQRKSEEEKTATMKPLFENLTCEICGGTMTKISATDAVCTQNEMHKRKLRRDPKEAMKNPQN